MRTEMIIERTRASRRLVGTVALGLLPLAAGACTAERPGALPEPEAAVDVAVSSAVSAGATESFPAALAAERRARVATRTSGRIREITVDVGSRVRAGQPLVILDDGDVRARLEAAEARATLAGRSFQRIENLAVDGAASQQELDEARARAQAASASVLEARAQLDYVVVSAPFDGYVASREAEPGDLASPGRPLLTVVGGARLLLEADLPGDRTGAVAVGDRVAVRVPAAGYSGAATIARVAPALEAGSRRLRVEAVLDPPAAPGGPLVAGAYARLELAGEGSGSLWIPSDAVVRRGQLTGVFQATHGELRLRWVRLGRARGDAVELLAGPAGELRVVRSPSSALRDGLRTDRVETLPWTPPPAVPTESGRAPSVGAVASPVDRHRGGAR